MWQEMRDSAKWEYDASQNANEQKTKLSIAALGNEAADSASKRAQLQTLGDFAFRLWDKF